MSNHTFLFSLKATCVCLQIPIDLHFMTIYVPCIYIQYTSMFVRMQAKLLTYIYIVKAVIKSRPPKSGYTRHNFSFFWHECNLAKMLPHL